jgi:hypothetical protein
VPNGRSGGFIIERTALERIVNAMPESIGAFVALEDHPKPRPIEGSEMVKLLGRCSNPASGRRTGPSLVHHPYQQPTGTHLSNGFPTIRTLS